MNNVREEWFDESAKVAITIVDVSTVAQELIRGHLCGPVASYYLSEALATAALLGAEMSEEDETIIVQMKCTGPLGGFNVECTAQGTLRGYTEKKVLDDFDGVVVQPIRAKDEAKILGNCQFQVTRSVPGRILSQGLANNIDAYLRDSLQRRASIALSAVVSDELEVECARGVLIEAMPDCTITDFDRSLVSCRLSNSSRNILSALGYPKAELRKSTPLKFACRCSPERAISMLAALSPAEKESLPASVDITCHMCGRTFTIPKQEVV